jgi:NAD(P)H-nitrite reductase large subunit
MKRLAVCFAISLSIFLSFPTRAQETKISKEDLGRITESLKTLNAYSTRYRGSRTVQSCTCKWAGGDTTCLGFVGEKECEQMAHDCNAACNYSKASCP